MDHISSFQKQAVAASYSEQSRNRQLDATHAVLIEGIAHLPRNAVLIDVGCGDGQLLQVYREMGFTALYGVEPSDGFRKMASAFLGAGVPVIGGCFQALPLRDKAADVMVSRYALHYCRDVSVGITEAARVLKAGGRFLAVIPYPFYDTRHPENHTSSGTIKHTLLDKTVSIEYPLHDMPEYTGRVFQKYFSGLQIAPLHSPTLDGANPGDVTALCLAATRNTRSAPSSQRTPSAQP